MKNLFINQLGFSMVQGMILASVLAGSGLMATKMLQEQKLVQKGIETRDQIEELHNVVYSVLQDNASCTRTMLQHGVTGRFNTPPPPGNPENAIQLNYIQAANGENVIQKYDNTLSAAENLTNRTYMSGNVQIRDIVAKYDHTSTTGLGTIEITYERLQSGNNALATVETTPDDGKRRMKAGYGAKTIKKIVGMRVQRNPVLAARPFTACYAITSSNSDTVVPGSTEAGNSDLGRKLCEDMIKDAIAAGRTPVFRWDNATSSCLPNSACPDHQIYTGISSNGEVRCRNLNEWVNFNDMIQPTQGACNPGQRASIQVTSTNPVRVRILCN